MHDPEPIVMWIVSIFSLVISWRNARMYYTDRKATSRAYPETRN